MLSKEQEVQIKQQIFQQIDSSFPEDKKAEAKAQLDAMNAEQLEEFLKQNNMVQSGAEGASGTGGVGAAGTNCIFCSIVSGDIPSHKVEGTKDAIAILEINPISKGHTIIIPKKHSEKIPKTAEKLAEKVSKLLKEKLKPKDVIISPATLFGHGIINVLPVYKDETLESEKSKASPDELDATLKKILQEEKKPIKKPKPKKIKEKLWLPKRIP
jgi:hypothetical protein